MKKNQLGPALSSFKSKRSKPSKVLNTKAHCFECEGFKQKAVYEGYAMQKHMNKVHKLSKQQGRTQVCQQSFQCGICGGIPTRGKTLFSPQIRTYFRPDAYFRPRPELIFAPSSPYFRPVLHIIYDLILFSLFDRTREQHKQKCGPQGWTCCYAL